MGKMMYNDIPFSSSFDNAKNISYDNTYSKLNSSNVQEAIDELNSNPGAFYFFNEGHIVRKNTSVGVDRTLLFEYKVPEDGIYLANGFITPNKTITVNYMELALYSTNAETVFTCFNTGDHRQIIGTIAACAGDIIRFYAAAANGGTELVSSNRYSSLHCLKLCRLQSE